MDCFEYTKDESVNMIACCDCGSIIEPNPSNMCIGCLQSKESQSFNIPRQGFLYFCSKCERYLQPPNTWVKASLESRELMSLCLKKLKGLNTVHLVDASFVWTEPHSMRIRVKLTIQREVYSAILQEAFIVEFTVYHQMCDACHRVEAKDFWGARVQVRQKAEHKKTLFYIEQRMLKNRIHTQATNIKSQSDGMDFYYGKQDDARKMVEFLCAVVPSKYTKSKELISHDSKSNIYHYKYTFCVDVMPLCRGDIVCLPRRLSQQLGSVSQLCVVARVTQQAHLIDPATLQIAVLNSTLYYRMPFLPLVTSKHLVEFMVMDIEAVSSRDRPYRTPFSTKHVLADVYVARMSDLGNNSTQFHTRSHLGHLLKAGDIALGFDFTRANLNHVQFNDLKDECVPHVMLVKKVYDRDARIHRRNWKLQRLPDNLHADGANQEYMEFLEDLEEDPETRRGVNVFRDDSRIPVVGTVVDDDDDDDHPPSISLQEMLGEMCIHDDSCQGNGASVME